MNGWTNIEENEEREREEVRRKERKYTERCEEEELLEVIVRILDAVLNDHETLE